MSVCSEYEVMDLIGRERFERLQLCMGGTRLYIPARLSPDNALVEIVGWEAAVACSRYLGNCIVHISKAAQLRERNRAITELGAAGYSTELMSGMLGLSSRTLRDILR